MGSEAPFQLNLPRSTRDDAGVAGASEWRPAGARELPGAFANGSDTTKPPMSIPNTHPRLASDYASLEEMEWDPVLHRL